MSSLAWLCQVNSERKKSHAMRFVFAMASLSHTVVLGIVIIYWSYAAPNNTNSSLEFHLMDIFFNNTII